MNDSKARVDQMRSGKVLANREQARACNIAWTVRYRAAGDDPL
jgi:hypothetical protein